MSKFYGGSYLRSDIDMMDMGAVQAAVYRYVEAGNADELTGFLSQDWAKTPAGKDIIKELMDAAKEKVSRNNAKAKKAEEDRDRDNPTWWLSESNQ